jgi:transitional endoplasmic reticulum ATPase
MQVMRIEELHGHRIRQLILGKGQPDVNIVPTLLKNIFYKLFDHLYVQQPFAIREFIFEHGDEKLLGQTAFQNFQDELMKHEKENPVGEREGKQKNIFIKSRNEQFIQNFDLEFYVNTIKDNWLVEDFKLPKNIKKFGKSISLDQLEMKILYLMYENEQTTLWYVKEYLDYFIKKIGSDYRALSIVLEVDQQKIKNILLGNTDLFRFGFFKKTSQQSDMMFSCLSFEFDERLKQILDTPEINKKDIENIFFPTDQKSVLSLDDYDDTIPHNIFKNLIKKNDRGTNFLLWGKPGTGKTEYAGALANSLGYKLIRVGESSLGEKKRDQRLGDFVLAQKFFKNKKNTILLFDELEDLTREDKEFSKLFVNNLLENATIPTIFTANHVYMETSFLRRMKYTAEFKVHSAKTRIKTWNKYGEKIFNETQKKQFAKTFDITPWDIQRVCEIIALNPKENVVDVVQQIDRMNRWGRKREFKLTESSKVYDLSLLNTNVNVNSFVDQLKSVDKKWNMLLSGPSGTGKSQLVHYLGEQFNKNVLVKKPSDLISAWFGETEQNIAQSFEQAYQEDSILLIDEAETFLTNKEGKSAEYMKSIANEFLVQTQLRKCDFAITTNYEKSLEQAFLRRFQIKIKFNYMTKDQKLKMFNMYWNREPDELILNDQYVLAPGDFETVKEFIDFGATEPPEILLKIESENKKEFTKQFGFAAN